MTNREKGVLLVISGPAGSGKGTAVKRLREMCPDLALSVSATTRDPRPGEVDGMHYHFKTRTEFLDMLDRGEILEYNEYCGNLYGTPAAEVRRALDDGRDMVLEIDVNGAANVKKVFSDAVSVMLIPPDAVTLERRLRGRGTETDEIVKKRMETARGEIASAESYDYIVISYDGEEEKCAGDLASILRAEKLRHDRMRGYTDAFFEESRPESDSPVSK